MFLTTQSILLVLIGGAFALMLRTYRKQNATEESFLCSILLMLAGCVVPESWLLFPAVWWAFTVLWSDCLRVYLASACAILLVLFYAVLAWEIFPDSPLVVFVEDNLTSAFSRTPIYSTAQEVCPQERLLHLYKLCIAAAAAFLGLWTLFAHLSKYTRANVRVQNFLLVTIPFFLLSLLSVLFPAANGNCMLSVLVATTLFLIGLYLSAYGFPRIRLPKRRRTGPNNRRWKHRKNPYKM